ncbi:putative 4-coumarate--CoA ligase 2 [Glarea lozoyensis 74030]|uniref:Putative 4-coumarate--CoA ligase 2 n=1 Tax=Glarea lozoyensis (strain ATCC 74030 / MF5533) TaxID=1104152 RepID=H0EUP0_GLAL7|nr:putative 4-coumarate--CoA ligase 2 [Glarea lozoyensis 74030]
MVFTSPSWCQDILMPIPNNELVGEFVMRRGHGLNDVSEDSPSSILGWDFNHGNPEDKVVAVCSLNSIDYVPLTWAIHRLGGICLLLHPTSSASELETLMRKANCKAVFTCKPLMAQCQAAFTAINGDPSNIFLVELPLPEEQPVKISNTTISQLIADGEGLPDLQPLDLQDFDSKERLAYFCPTSGTSGFLGIQVPPVEIEGHLVAHPAVDDAAVVAISDEDAGERPFAFVVRSQKVMTDIDEKSLKKDISGYIQSTLSEPYWLRQNIRFIDAIPKSHNGKALKFKLKQQLVTSSA